MDDFKTRLAEQLILNRLSGSDYGTDNNNALDSYIKKTFGDSDKLKELLDEKGDSSNMSPEDKLKELEKAGIELGPNWKEYIVTEGLPIVGDLARGLGTYYSARDYMLAKALQNMANVTASNSQKKFYGPTAYDLGAAQASPALEAAGTVAGAAGELVGNRLDKIASDLRNDYDRERMLKYQHATDPSSEFWRYYSKTTPSVK